MRDNIDLVTGFSVFKWQALSAWRLYAYVGFPLIPPSQFILSDIVEEATAPLVSLNSCYISPLLRAKGSKTLNLGPDLVRIFLKTTYLDTLLLHNDARKTSFQFLNMVTVVFIHKMKSTIDII